MRIFFSIAGILELYSFIFAGSELQICPRGLTCCTEEMEKKLWVVSRDQYGKAIQSAASQMQRSFNQWASKFDGKNNVSELNIFC